MTHFNGHGSFNVVVDDVGLQEIYSDDEECRTLYDVPEVVPTSLGIMKPEKVLEAKSEGVQIIDQYNDQPIIVEPLKPS